jgi:tRNA threonylcarbamoyladenosine biosynthesis protein TsaB
MQILAIDTASPRPAVSLLANDALFEEELPSDRRSSEALLPAVARVLDAANTRLRDCERLVVCSGPGSFTGIRIGLATAWALSRATGVPVEAVSTLEALTESVRESGVDQVAAVLDAGRGELVVERFALGGTRARSLSPPTRIAADRIVAAVAGDPVVELPRGLTGAPALAAGMTPSSALALAVSRAPGDAASAPVSASYSRRSAAEEKHGAS